LEPPIEFLTMVPQMSSTSRIDWCVIWLRAGRAGLWGIPPESQPIRGRWSLLGRPDRRTLRSRPSTSAGNPQKARRAARARCPSRFPPRRRLSSARSGCCPAGRVWIRSSSPSRSTRSTSYPSGDPGRLSSFTVPW